MSTLNSINRGFKAEGGALRVCKGALVVMKEKKKNGLYIFHRSTVTGITIVPSMFDFDIIRLWHMQLRHISERELSELRKQGLL